MKIYATVTMDMSELMQSFGDEAPGTTMLMKMIMNSEIKLTVLDRPFNAPNISGAAKLKVNNEADDDAV